MNNNVSARGLVDAQGHPQGRPQLSRRSLSILLIEDNPGDVRLVRELVADAPLVAFDVYHVGCLGEALSALEGGVWDVVALDLSLPDGEGLDGLRQIREAAPDVAVVVLTGLTDFETAIEAVRLGAQDFLVKGSFDEGLLTRALAHAAERKENMLALERARQQARASESRFRSLMELVSDVAYEMERTDDGAYRIVWITESAERMSGEAADALCVPDGWKRLIHPGDVQAVEEQLDLVFEGMPVTVRFRFRIPGGDIRWAESNKAPIQGADGSVVAMRGVLKDITDRVEVEERFKVLFESMTQGVVFQDAAGLIFSANPAAEQILGLSLDQMQGRVSMDPRWRTVDADGRDFPGEQHPAMVALRTGEVVQGVVMGVFNPSLDEQRWLLVDAVPQFRKGEEAPFQVYTLFNDVTEWQRATEALRRSRDELEKEQRYLQALFDSSLDAILLADDDGYYIDANPAACAMLGYTREELRTMRIADITPLPDVANAMERFREFLGGGSVAGEFVAQCKDGTHCVTEYRAANILPGVHLAVLRDVTERHRTEQERRKLAAIVESTSDAVISTDTYGVITTWNAAAEALYGYARAETVGLPIEMIVPPGRRDAFAHAISQVLDGQHLERFETVRQRRDGDLVDVSVNLFPVFDRRGEVVRLAFVEYDISGRKAYERGLVAAKEKAEEMGRLKDAFLANMSHEIRTPLTSILGFTEVLKEEATGEVLELVGLIRQSGERLMSTLNSVLDLSQLHGGSFKLKRGPVDMLAMARKTIALFQPQAERQGLRLKLEVLTGRPLWVLADEGAVERVLSNLVSNAVKFTNEGCVTIRLDATAADLMLQVEDTGIGIGEDFLPHVFDEFRQESTGDARSYEGNGLGLAITRHLINLMNGTVSVRSDRGFGTVFTVTLPAASADALPAMAAPAGLPDSEFGKGACLLTVEDDPNVVWIVRRLLHEAEVHEAGDGTRALALARTRSYDAVLLDINLRDGESGEEVMRALRRIPGYGETPMVALTAYALPGDEERFLAAGFDAYLSKPFEKRKLVACLNGVFAGRIKPASP